MRISKFILSILFISFVSIQSFGSRLAEIEEYFVAKATNILKTRFPDKPFIVLANIDTGDEKKGRREPANNRRDTKNTRLPYLEIDEEDPDIWDRTDIPLGTLINHVKKIQLKIQIDSSLTEPEIKELQENLISQLNLDPSTDGIEITKMDWTAPERAKKVWVGVGLSAAFIVFLFSALWFVSRLSVGSLVKGLSKPIAEIGKTTQAFANNALNMVSDKQYSEKSEDRDHQNSNDQLDLGANLLEIRKSALELLTRNRDLLANPDAEVMDFIERRGSENPAQMGAILAELNDHELKTLFKYGTGVWWFVALAQPQPMAPTALTILNELDRLRLRRHFAEGDGAKISNEIREASLIFGRLGPELLTQILAGLPLEKCEAILDRLPRELALAAAKKLYPGQWAVLLDNKRKSKPLDIKLLEQLEEKARQALPLREEDMIKSFFAELDLVRFLDSASPRDEKDFYMVLPQDSRIRTERKPFYEIFEAPPEVKKLMGSDLSPREWAYALNGCESSEANLLITGFSQRLAFLIKEESAKIKAEKVDLIKFRSSRRQAVRSYLKNTEIIKTQAPQQEEASQHDPKTEQKAS